MGPVLVTSLSLLSALSAYLFGAVRLALAMTRYDPSLARITRID